MTQEDTFDQQFNSEDAKTVLLFLQRTNLQGSEVPAYVHVVNRLTSVVEKTSPDQSQT